MKKPPAKKPAAAKVPPKAVPKKAAPAKKPLPKKPGPGAAAAHKAHLAHQAHLTHLAHLGLTPKGAPKKPAPKPRQLALGEGVACCAAEALAASLRLAGRRVDDGDVLALYRRTASDPDTGASIVATLQAAARYGVAGWRPRFSRCLPVASGSMGTGGGFGGFASAATAGVVPAPEGTSALILGVEMPGSHAVLASADGWWSWGDLHDPACWPDAVIEEAWTLMWAYA